MDDDRYDRIAKVELHCHLEGTVRPATVVHLAAKAGCPLPVDDPTQLYTYDSLDSKEPKSRDAHRAVSPGAPFR